MKTFGICILLILLTSCSKPVSLPIDETSLRHLPQGDVVGVAGKYDNHMWLGIPFAQPPIEKLRWRSPQTIGPWQERFEAKSHGEACAQFGGSTGGIPGEKGKVVGSEDCLYLSVYAPKLESIPAKKLPVMVWLHGGSNRHGAGSMYDGSRLAGEQNVIIVSINYRLGPFGWFYHPALNINGNDLDRSGNYGTLDILQSLHWVQDNIAFFGGDKNNVTLFGESAGAFDTLSLMLSPLSEGLFHKAISQSGGINLSPIDSAMNYLDDEVPGHEFSSQQVELYLRVQDRTQSNLVSAKSQVTKEKFEERNAYLLNKTTEEIMAAYGYGKEIASGRSVNVIADGLVLPFGDPIELFADPEKHLDIPLIIGTNRDEMRLYLYGNPKYVDAYLSFYSVIKNEENYEATADYLTRMWKYNGVDRVATALNKSHMLGSKNKVWGYRFDWDEQARPLGMKLDKLIGAGHGMEIPFVFGFTSDDDIWSSMHDDSNKQSRESLSEIMRSYWGAFAHNDKPGRGLMGKQFSWLPWDNSSPQFIVLDTTGDGGIKMSHELVTMSGIAEDIANDNRLASDAIKCEVFAALSRGGDKHWPSSEYENQLDGACQNHPQ